MVVGDQVSQPQDIIAEFIHSNILHLTIFSCLTNDFLTIVRSKQYIWTDIGKEWIERDIGKKQANKAQIENLAFMDNLG